MDLLVLFAAGLLVTNLVERGALDEAAATLARHAPADPLPVHGGSNIALVARGQLRAAQGRPAEALADLLEAGARQQAAGIASPELTPWRPGAVEALVRMERFGEAARLADEELALARAVGTPYALGGALRAAGLARRGPAGVALLEQAVDTLASSPCRLESARALVDLGGELHRSGRRRDARARLEAGMDLAHRCGSRLLAQRARELLRRTGARPRRAARTGVDALTPSERRVARLAAGGMTNREIAQALFVTQKAVEMHLSRTYAKLGVRSRRELPETLAS